MYMTKPLTSYELLQELGFSKHFPIVAAALAEDRQWVYMHNIDFHQERVRDEFVEHGLEEGMTGKL